MALPPVEGGPAGSPTTLTHVAPSLASGLRPDALLCAPELLSCLLPPSSPSLPAPPSTARPCPRSNYNQLSQTTQASQTITTVSGAKTYLGAYGLRSSPAGMVLDQAFIDSVAPILNSASQNQYNMMALQVGVGVLCAYVVCVWGGVGGWGGGGWGWGWGVEGRAAYARGSRLGRSATAYDHTAMLCMKEEGNMQLAGEWITRKTWFTHVRGADTVPGNTLVDLLADQVRDRVGVGVVVVKVPVGLVLARAARDGQARTRNASIAQRLDVHTAATCHRAHTRMRGVMRAGGWGGAGEGRRRTGLDVSVVGRDVETYRA